MKNKIFYFLLLITSTIYSQEVILPFSEKEGWPIVQVEINNENYNFLFDTAAGITVVNSNSIENLNVTENIETGDINNTTENMPVAILPQLKLGEKRYLNSKVAYKNLESLNKNLCEIKLDGIIGIDLMKDFIIEFKSQEKLIKFYNKKSFDSKKVKHFSKNKYKHNIPTMKLRIDKQKRYASFDTGSNDFLTLSDYKLSSFIDRNKHLTSLGRGALGISSSKDNITKHEFINTNIKFGKFSLKNQAFTLNDQNQNNIGFEFIKQFDFFLDVSNKIIYLKKHPGFNISKSNLSKYGFSAFYDFKAKNYYVSSITEKNEQLLIGDIILKINNKVLPQEYCDLSTFLKQHMESNMFIHIIRNGKEKVIQYNYS